jgi:hypothetical protein
MSRANKANCLGSAVRFAALAIPCVIQVVQFHWSTSSATGTTLAALHSNEPRSLTVAGWTFHTGNFAPYCAGATRGLVV